MRWEYWAAEYKPDFFGAFDIAKMMTDFNALGEEGWELVSTEAVTNNNGSRTYIFKRRADNPLRSTHTEER